MVEQDAITGKQVITFTVVNGNPVRVEFGDTVWGARMKGSILILRSFLNLSVELATGRLIKFGIYTRFSHGFKDPKCAKSGDICCIFRNVETYAHVTLCSKVIYFIGSYLCKNPGNTSIV